MNKLLCIAAAAGTLLAFPALAADQYSNGTGLTNIWSSAQGTANSYGLATAFSTSSAGAAATINSLGNMTAFKGNGITQSITTSNANTSTTGPGYAQAQTSGYAGGTLTLNGNMTTTAPVK
jgi:hypothetical protein